MDILLSILLVIGFVTGLVSGAVKQVISLAAFVVGFVVACLFCQPLGEMLDKVAHMPTFCRIVAFLVLWIAVPLVARLIASLFTSVLDNLPALGFLNRLLGGILGTAKYALVLGAFVWLFSSMGLIKETTMQESRLCKPLKSVPEHVYNFLKASSSQQGGGLEEPANE